MPSPLDTAEYDYATDIEVQREEAMRIGEERGVEQGIEQGIEQEEYRRALEDAKNLKHFGVSSEIISQSTGLSLEEIENL